MTKDEGEMAELTSGFYRDLYCSEGKEDMDTLLAVVPRKVAEEMNAKLDLRLLFEGGDQDNAISNVPDESARAG